MVNARLLLVVESCFSDKALDNSPGLTPLPHQSIRWIQGPASYHACAYEALPFDAYND